MRRATGLLIVGLGIAQVVAAQDAAPAWTSSIGAGIATTSGNTNTQNYNASFATKYDPKTRFVFKADALLLRGSAEGATQVDKSAASARGELTVSERTFAFTEVTYLRDPFKDIRYSVAPVAGAGYRVLADERRTLTVDVAAGVQVASEPGEGRTTSSAIKAGESFEWKFSPTGALTQKVTGLWHAEEPADALYHFDAGVTTTLASRLELKVAWIYDYKTRPVTPGVEKGDSALFAALLVKF